MGALSLWQKSVNSIWSHESLPERGIDLGNGHTMHAEDVLEGHYRRMTSYRQPLQGQAARQVRVQVGDNLTAKIAVLAPQLSPLTEVAEQVSGVVPLIEPERRFRENLHQALERTHRQQNAQRVLGMRPAAQKQSTPFGWWMVVAGVLATVALYWGLRWRHNTLPAS
jgi:hypothetical protein